MTDSAIGALPQGLEDNLGWLLGQVSRAHGAVLASAVSELPHGLRGFQALCGAVHGSARNQAQLGRQLDIDRTVMVYLVDDLVAAGLVERVVDPGDRRNKLILGTEAGRKLLEKTKAAILAAEAEVLAPLAHQDQDRFREMLRAVVAHNLGGR
ncbi:MarR family winged helix-turn-helix transcriptional regulator [Amycolatopsis azurea]|uniref:MarR family transcriptional regulator n=1 Tax=Amycolatopsis azurea DSM 43854 TaxID=1238180 RepID=M2QFE3_9PSEU|nr:MarR family transcriptional regulator [Amycolatopsis azurea]EMD24752.1 Transcriptional regulator, MarR family [Amycolatopsis azurea DSM 43854]OOC08243.1 MarR family transcriptional regulator [Amycolatopsis azurea DSM 43854]